MGGLMGGKPDNSAALAQIEQSRKDTERMRMESEAEKRDLQEQMAARKEHQLVVDQECCCLIHV